MRDTVDLNKNLDHLDIVERSKPRQSVSHQNTMCLAAPIPRVVLPVRPGMAFGGCLRSLSKSKISNSKIFADFPNLKER